MNTLSKRVDYIEELELKLAILLKIKEGKLKYNKLEIIIIIIE